MSRSEVVPSTFRHRFSSARRGWSGRTVLVLVLSLIAAPVVSLFVEPVVTTVPRASAATSVLVDFEGHSPVAGLFIACALETGSDAVWCWGGEAHYVTGNSAYAQANTDTALKVPDGLAADGGFVNAGVDQIAIAGSSVCALKEGSLYCWGENTHGEIGDGSAGVARSTPRKLIDRDGFVNSKIISVVGSTGTGNFTEYAAFCAIRDPEANDDGTGGDGDGVLYCWGNNQRGKLGISSSGVVDTTPKYWPTTVSANAPFTNTDVSTVAVGFDHTCVIEVQTAYCAGRTYQGQLGNGQVSFSDVAWVPVSDQAGPGNLASPTEQFANSQVLGLTASADYTCAVRAEAVGGMVYCWGFARESSVNANTRYLPQVTQAFNFSQEWSKPYPLADDISGDVRPANASVSAAALGFQMGCLVKDLSGTRSAYCWGREQSIGTGLSGTGRGYLSTVSATSEFTNTAVDSISAGFTVTCADENNAVYCWGVDAAMLGGGVLTTPYTPVKVKIRYYGPSAPTNLVEVANDATTGEVTVSFTASTASALTSLHDYQYSLDGGSTWQSTTPSTSASPIVMRLPSSTYSLKLRARATVDGDPTVAPIPGDESTTLSVTASCTTCPTITTVRPADPDLPAALVPGDRVAVTGTGFDNPSSITLSGIACTLDAATLTPTAFECDLASSGTPVGTEISFLTNGQALAIGNASSVVWATTPRAPTALSPVTGDGEIVLGFTPPVSPDGSAMSFEYSFDAGSSWVSPSPTVSSSPVTISGLAPGTYTVTLRAVNDSGAGAVATTSALSVTCATCPGIPSDVVALPGDSEIVVAFTPPASGSTPTNYQYTTTSGSTWVSFDPAVTTSPVTISGLTNATRYTVAIRAVVSVSGIVYPGATSATLSATAGTPASPGLVAGDVNPGDGEIVISFTDPTPTSSSPITNYEYTLDGGTTWRAFSPAVTTGPVTISSLASGTYGVALRPVNAVGVGDTTEVVTTSVVCSLCPTAPTDLVGAPANGAIEIAFTDPIPAAGMSISNFEYTTTSGLTWVALSPAVTTSPVTLPGFTNGQDAVVAIRALGERASDSAVFPGSSSVTVSVRPGTPTSGTNPTLTPGDGELQVGYTVPPQSTDSSAISNFEFSLDGGQTWTPMNPTVSAPPFAIEDLTSGTYSVSIRALNSSGRGVATSAQSVSVTCASCPDAPTDLEVVPGNTVAVIDFTAPAAPGGTTIADYEYSTTSGLTWVSVGSAIAPVTVSGLTNLQTYDIALRAVTSNGVRSYRGAASTTVSVTPGLPSAPRELTITAGDGEIEITFDDPVFIGSSPLTNYEVTTTSGVTWVALSPAVTTSPITLDGLLNGTAYGISLRAVTAQGSGQSSPVVSVTPVAPGAGAAPPAPPAVVAAPSTPPIPGVSGPRPVAVPPAGTPPSLVDTADVPRLQQPPGAATASRDGVVTPVVVRSVPSDVAAIPPAARSLQQVATIRSTARDLIDRLEPLDDPSSEDGTDPTTDPTSSMPRLEVVDTPTGAELTGVLVDPRDGVTPVPVPVEDVRLVEVGDTRVLLAAADYRGTPARVVEGVLEVTQGGAVAALATGLPAGVPGEVVVLSTPQLMGTFTSDASGRFAGQLELPDGLEAGPHTVVLASGGITVSLGVVVNADTDMLPVRALDTRRAESVGGSRLQAGETRRIRIAGTTGVGLDATSVTVNVTVVDPADAGYVRLASCDAGDIEVSTVNFAAGETVANTAILGLGSGELCAYASAPVDLVIDVLDSRDRGFTPVEPRRLVDTRAPETWRPEAGEVTVVAVAGRGGVPLDATAVVLNVTVVEADGWGFATVFACDGTPSTSNLNYTHGQTRANLVVTALGADGTVCVSSYARADLVVDVFGWYDDEFTPVSHTRLLDTRAPGSTGDGIAAGEGRVEAGEVRRVRILGRGGLGSAPTTVAVNLTLVDALGAGWARIWACDAREPETSNVNVVAGDTRANAALVVFTDDADLCLRSTVDAHVLIDVTGAFED